MWLVLTNQSALFQFSYATFELVYDIGSWSVGALQSSPLRQFKNWKWWLAPVVNSITIVWWIWLKYKSSLTWASKLSLRPNPRIIEQPQFKLRRQCRHDIKEGRGGGETWWCTSSQRACHSSTDSSSYHAEVYNVYCVKNSFKRAKINE